jgi:hypothetical protein
MNKHEYLMPEDYNKTGAPWAMRDSIEQYVLVGRPVGHFLEAVISNRFKDACFRADDDNIKILRTYAYWFHNHTPHNCEGSPEAYKKWVEVGGLKGQMQTMLKRNATKEITDGVDV